MITRKEWARKQSRCWICGRTCNLETHEIANGAARQKALKEPCTWMRACCRCHRGDHGLHSASHWPLARQLALKLLRDHAHFDRSKVLKLKGFADTAVTRGEIIGWAEKMTRPISETLSEMEL